MRSEAPTPSLLQKAYGFSRPPILWRRARAPRRFSMMHSLKIYEIPVGSSCGLRPHGGRIAYAPHVACCLRAIYIGSLNGCGVTPLTCVGICAGNCSARWGPRAPPIPSRQRHPHLALNIYNFSLRALRARRAPRHLPLPT